MADVGKLMSREPIGQESHVVCAHNYVRAFDFFSRAFEADCMIRIAYIYSHLPRTHSFHFDFQRQHTHTHTHSLSLSLSHFDFQQSTPRKCIHSATFFFLVLLFQLDFFQPRIQPQKFLQTPKETNNQHRRRHVPPRIRCYILNDNT